MATFPIDTAQFRPICMSAPRPAAHYSQGPQGQNVYTPGMQGTDDFGVPLWDLDAAVPGDGEEQGRMVTLTIKVASREAPAVSILQPLAFEGLTMSPRVDRRTNQLAISWRAEKVFTAQATPARPLRAAGGE